MIGRPSTRCRGSRYWPTGTGELTIVSGRCWQPAKAGRCGSRWVRGESRILAPNGVVRPQGGIAPSNPTIFHHRCGIRCGNCKSFAPMTATSSFKTPQKMLRLRRRTGPATSALPLAEGLVCLVVLLVCFARNRLTKRWLPRLTPAYTPGGLPPSPAGALSTLLKGAGKPP